MSRAAPYRARGSRQSRLIRSQVLLSGIALLACLIVLGGSVYGVFKVRHVDVIGANLPHDDIVFRSQVLGQNIFTVRSDTVVARLSHLHEIVVQRVDTGFPNRVIIYAQERTPVVAWQDGHNLYEIDPNGKFIKPVGSTTLPIIVGQGPISPAQGVPLSSGDVAAVLYAAQHLPAHPGGAIARFQFAQDTGLSILSRNGWTAIVGSGSAQALCDRIATLGAVLDHLGSRASNLQLVDLRGSAPYYRMRGA